MLISSLWAVAASCFLASTATAAHPNFASSDICETTPGVQQYSGYIEVGQNMSMFFWYFESRQAPGEAPLVAWMNGGPGCSSMIGAFQEHGPCKFFNGSDLPSNNSYSWNNAANMLYLDQPINTGFSTGTPRFNSTFTAAPYVWTFLQNFIVEFPELEDRALGLFGESYGGHWVYYAEYIAEQNDLIAQGKLEGKHINLSWLGLNNAWYDPIIQMKAHVDYSYLNGYLNIINETKHAHYINEWETYCKSATEQCQTQYGNDEECINAGDQCYDKVEAPLIAEAEYDVYDIRQKVATNPPETYVGYLARPDIQEAIGAKVNYTECASGDQSPGYRMQLTGDNSRTMLPYLTSFVNRGIPTLIWAGDTDWICDWMGSFAVVNTIEFPGAEVFRNTTLAPYKIDGVEKGMYKKSGNFSFMRVYEAGHEIPVFQPEVGLHVFQQFLETNSVSSD